MTARWCAALLLAAWPAAGAADPHSGAIEGTAVDRTGSRPVRKVTVELSGAHVSLRVATDAAGHFAFRGLPAGDYSLDAVRTGYRPDGASSAWRGVRLDAGERKEVEIRMVVEGSISGRITDDEEAPLPGCSAQAADPAFLAGRRLLMPRAASTTDQNGEYRISGLSQGRYYVLVTCHAGIPIPHPLMAAGDPRRQSLEFVPRFYPGVPGLEGASPVDVGSGAEVRGIDLRMSRTPGGLLTGRVGAVDPALLKRPFQIVLRSASPDFNGWPFPPLFPGRDREFHFPVTPGSYLLVASAWEEGPVPVYTAELALDLKEMPPDPVQLVLVRCPDISGTVEVEGANAQPVEGLQVLLDPIESLFTAKRLSAQVNANAFTLPAVVPGRWRLSVPGQAYVKSLTIGGTEASPDAFDVPQGGTGPMRFVLSTKR